MQFVSEAVGEEELLLLMQAVEALQDFLLDGLMQQQLQLLELEDLAELLALKVDTLNTEW